MAKVERNAIYATGRRKCAVARVWLMPGSGKVTINQRTIDNYFGRATSKMVLRQPLELTSQTGNYDVYCNVSGGGLSGQADAIKLGITRALMQGGNVGTLQFANRQASCIVGGAVYAKSRRKALC